MKLLRFSFFSICLGLLGSNLWAQNIGNCDKASDEIKFAQNYSPSELRLKRMSIGLLPDIRTLLKALENPPAGVPKKYISNCLEKKVLAFDTHVKNAGGDVVGNPEFNATVGERLMLEKNYSAAYVFFSRAAIVDVLNPSFHRRRFDSWIYWQLTHLKDLDKDKYYRDLLFHLTPLLELKGVSRADREEAHIQIAQAAVLLKHLEEVAPHFLAVLALNPERGEAVVNLSQFYLLRGDETKAMDLLKKYAPKQTQDNKYTMEIYERLAILLRKNKKYDLAAAYLNQAQTHFENNTRLRALAARAKAENQEFQTAENLSSNQRIQSLDDRRTQALIAENKGDGAFKKKMYGKANDFYVESLGLFSNNPELRVKMAQALFQAHSDSGFNNPGLPQDMDRALLYLQPLYQDTSVSNSALGLYIQTASRSSKPVLAIDACRRYTQLFGDINSINIAKDCLKVKASIMANDPETKKLEKRIQDLKKSKTRIPASIKTNQSKN